MEDYRLQLAEANILQSKFDKKTLSVSDVSLLQDVLPISYENIYDDEVAKDYFSYKKKKNDLFGNGNHKLALAMYTRRKCDEPVMFFNPGDNIGYKRTTKTLSPAANDLPKIIEMMDGYVFSNAKNYLMPEQNNQLMVIKTFAELTKSVSSRIDVNNAFQLKTSTYLGRFLTKAQHETEILPEGKFEYVEIGDVDNFGQVVETHTLDGSIISEIRSRSNLTNDEIKTVLNYEFEIDDSIEIALYAKVIKGDIFKPSLGEVLVSKTRPNLKKIVLVDERVANVYFTKGFIPFVTRDINPESS